MRSLAVQQVLFVVIALPRLLHLIRSSAFQTSQRRSRSSNPDEWRLYANSAHQWQTEAQLELLNLMSHIPWRRLLAHLRSSISTFAGQVVRNVGTYDRVSSQASKSSLQFSNYATQFISLARSRKAALLLRDSHVHNSPRHSAANPPPNPANQAEIKRTPGNLILDAF